MSQAPPEPPLETPLGHDAYRFGGVDLREASLASVHHLVVGMVPQEPHLVPRHGPGQPRLRQARATEAEMREVLAAAHVLDRVDSPPPGLDTVVGDRGHRLSGGEKQRLAIARLLLKAPQVVVLDEATAHLDSQSEVAVQRALDAALDGRTPWSSPTGSRRCAAPTIASSVDRGRIVDRGLDPELLAQGGLYAELYRTQFLEGATPVP